MTDNTAFNQEWGKMQDAFWQMNGQDDSEVDNIYNQWLDTLNVWWQQLHNGNDKLLKATDPLYKKLLGSSRIFYSFAEPFLKPGQPGKVEAGNFVTCLENYLELIGKDQQTPDTVNGFWRLPLEFWWLRPDFMARLPDDFIHFVSTCADSDVPDLQAFAEACESYHRALLAFQKAYISMSLRAANELQQKLNAEQEEMGALQMFNSWVAIFEKHYSRFVRAAEYARLYGDSVNCWMRLIQQTELILEPWLKSMNMPTRADMEQLQKENAELRALLYREPGDKA